ncbi:hypothetical protein GQ42DRAFT_91691 [Ramicandelaber brevisporus]|nr:hypothetical protein GQ42DRAFT_91691 [Ramicandelaber brevisporus]
MDISKLLNPVPNKKSRFDEDTLVCDRYWLPAELIARILMFLPHPSRPPLRFVSKKWYDAYDLFIRNREFSDASHVGSRRVTRRQVLDAFVKYGHRLRWMDVRTSTLREILDIEPNFASLIPNAIRLYVTVDDGLSSQRWIGDIATKLHNLKGIFIKEYGFTADEHIGDELDKAVATMPRLEIMNIDDISLDFTAFPGPNMKERASQISRLVVPVANIAAGAVASTFRMFKSIKWLGLSGISGVDVLKEITELVLDEKSFPAMNRLEVIGDFDISHASPIVNEEDGTMTTAMDLYLKICGIRRPQLELILGFILGACSKSNLALIEKEREFVINLGKAGGDILVALQLTHYTPVGDYDPLTTLLFNSALRFPRLLFLILHVSPSAATGLRIIEAFNNPFLLPHLVQANFFVDGMQSPEWINGFNPIDPSRGFDFNIYEKQHEDETRMVNETSNGVLPSHFLS